MSRNEATEGTIIENEEQLTEVSGGAGRMVHRTLPAGPAFDLKKVLEALRTGNLWVKSTKGGIQPA
jgi:hypothetical protein